MVEEDGNRGENKEGEEKGCVLGDEEEEYEYEHEKVNMKERKK